MRGHSGPYLKRSVRLTRECYQKLDQLAELLGVPRTSVIAVAIDNYYRTRFYDSGKRRPATMATEPNGG